VVILPVAALLALALCKEPRLLADDPAVSLVSAVPGTFMGFSQPSPLTFTFAGPVRSVTVTGQGAISCSGDQGTLTGYDSAGHAIGSVSLHLIDPADCSPEDNPDNVTFGATATLVTTGVMAKAILSPMSLLEFPVFDLVGHASQDYTVELGVGTAPPATLSVTCDASVTRGNDVKCTASVDPRQPFVVTERHAAGAGYSFTSAERIESDGAPYEWSGKAVLDTHVSITVAVTQNGAETPLAPGTADFTVIARTGPEWTGLKIQSTAPAPEYVSGAPLADNPFPTVGSLLAPDGATGKYQQTITYRWGTVGGGPNTNLVYTRAPATVEASRIFIHAWLLSDSRFYKAQRGNSNPILGQRDCNGADIDRLRNNVIAHETLHYSEDKKFFDTHDVQAALEAAHAPFHVSQLGQPGSDDALKAARDAASDAAFGTAWKAVAETAVDTGHPVDTPSCRAAKP